MIKKLFIFVFIIILFSSLQADTIVTIDKKRLEGKITSETSEEVTIQLKYGEIKIKKSDIVSIDKNKTVWEEYEERSKEIAGTAQAHYELGKWCQKKELLSDAKFEFKRALELDKDFEPAAKELKQIKVEGEGWVTEERAKELQGFVLHKGKWIKKEELDSEIDKLQPQFRQEENLPENFYIIKRGNYIFCTETGKEKAKEMHTAAEALYEAVKNKFEKFLNEKEKEPLKILLFKNRDNYAKFTLEDGVEKAGTAYGYYSGTKKKAYLFENSSNPSTLEMLFHEGTHQIFVERMMPSGGSVTGWFFEGMAEYFEGADYKNNKLILGTIYRNNLMYFKEALEDGYLKIWKIEPFLESKTITDFFPFYGTQECKLAYAEAWLLFYYFLHSENGKNFRNFLKYFEYETKGKGSIEIFKQIIEKDPNKFAEKVKAYAAQLR
ncbi:MAG: DUF1570 domain-containing protein [Planctomycetota bacterium]